MVFHSVVDLHIVTDALVKLLEDAVKAADAVFTDGVTKDQVRVTGLAPGRSNTRDSTQFSRSTRNGSSSHQPWLIIVRLKLKVGGVAIEISINLGAEASLPAWFRQAPFSF